MNVTVGTNARRRFLLNFIHSVPDYRRMNKGNCKHKLSDMLLLVILARACGCETRKDIVAFGTIHLCYLQDRLGILAKGCPSEPTLCRMEDGIDNVTLISLVSTLSRKYVSEHDGTNRRHIAIDGKFMLGTKISDGCSPDVVTAFSVTDMLPLDTEVTIDTHTIEKNSGTEQKQTRYYITRMEEGAQTLDRISRMHWGIENNLHWTLDARMSQDSTKRKETKSARNLHSL